MYSVTMALQTTRAQAIIPMPDPEPDPDPIPETVGSPDRNYILTRTYTSENGVKWQDKIDYFDNMGHPEQSVLVKNSPSYNDLVTLLEYDALGREQKSWLPAIVPENNGVYTLPGTVMSSSRTSNGNDPSPFSKPVYDGSPLNLIVEQYGPGNDWHANGRSVKTDRMTNLSAADAQVSAGVDVKPQYLTAFIYKATSTGITNEGTYPTGTLHVIRTTDEDNNTSFEFKDKAGRVILARHINNDSVYDTYRVYNDYGKERIVLPPIASDLLATAGSWEENNNILQKYTYIYKYDAYNRCILKKLPGCEPVYYVYDKADRLIFSQDGMQRERKEWSFSIPDAFGQTVLTGICKNAFDYTSSPLENNVVKATWAKVNNATKGYTVTGVTLETPVVLTANYYDNYEFTGWNAIPDTLAGGSPTKYETASGYGTRHTGGCKGLLTGVLTAKQLPDGTISQDYLYSVMYYDNRSRVIQTKSSNHLGGNEKEYTSYNFTGQPVKMKHVHSAEGKETQTEIYSYTYDHAGRLKTTKHQLNSASETLLVDNEYDELGRLKANKRSGQANLQTNYTYTIRSWMKSLTGTLFNQTLYYQDSYAGNTPSYSGNISAMSWNAHADKKRGYTFNYDSLARLKKSAYLEADLANTNYSTNYEYDKHGNIKSLSRNGRTGATTFGTVDALTLNYNGNQLVKVEDSATDPTLSQSADFKNRIKQPVEYTYDRNGSLKTDLNKGISDISYNSLNLPSKLVIANSLGSATNTYLYAADGKKLNVTMHWGASNSKSTDYAGSKIYENSSLKRVLVDGGYIENGVYHYYLQDHLGNNRVVAKADGTVVQTNHYYPFGMAFAEGVQNSSQPFKYNGKELDAERGLNLYDYVARCMDAALGRFTRVDPLAEKYYAWSPYAYCYNNPFKYIDPDGKEIQIPPGNGVMDWSREKQIRVASHANKANAAANNIFKGSEIKVSSSMFSAKGSIGIGSVKGTIKVGLGNISVKTNGNKVSATASVGEGSAQLSVNSASLKTEVSTIEANITVNRKANTSADFKFASGDSKVQIGEKSNTIMNSNSKVSVGARVSIVEADLSIDFEAIGQWMSGTLNSIVEILTPEINLNVKRNQQNN